MKAGILKPFILTLILGSSSLITNAQIVDGHAYMVGDYVEVGINENGHEGAPCPEVPEMHCRGGADMIGFVANPQEDGWVEFDGDFFTPGSPESTWGCEFTLLGETYDFDNSAATGSTFPGSIIDFTETDDSVSVTWQGSTMDLEITILYELQKDQHYYRTSVLIENLGVETFEDVYFYRNFDADNNQSIGGTFSTTNTIVSQSGVVDDSCIVESSQSLPWESVCILAANGVDWKAYTGSFFARDAVEMWTGTGPLNGTEGYSNVADQAIGLVHLNETILPGKASSDWFSFTTSFKRGIDFSVEDDDDEPTSGISTEKQTLFEMYPNPSNGENITVSISGKFNYTITDIKGSVVLSGNGNNLTTINIADMDKGIYFMNINQENNKATEKLIIE